MKKLIIPILLLFTIIALPLLGQSDEKPKLADEKLLKIKEAKAWSEIEVLAKKTVDKKIPYRDRYKFKQQLHKKYGEYLNKFFGLNKERTKSTVNKLMYYCINYRKNKEFLEYSKNWFKSDVLDSYIRERIQIYRGDAQIGLNKYEEALKEIKGLKLPKEKSANEDKRNYAIYLSVQARSYHKLKRKEEFEKAYKALKEIYEKEKDKTINYTAWYYLSKTNSYLLEVGKAAPAWTLKDLDGNTVSLSDFKGKVVLIDFWATW